MLKDSWTGLYREGWGRNRLRLASFAHPAKNSYGLSVRIYEHALEEGWIEPGQTVLDPFAGIGGFALEAMRHGLNFVGCELEQRFVDMGQGCDCTGIGKADWIRFQGRWDKARYQDGRHWCPECIMRAGMVADEREFKPLPLPGTKWAALAKTHQATLFDAAPTASYVRNSGKIPCTEPHHYRGNIETWERQGMAGSAVIVQGDSRRLGEVLAEARLCLSSPPYSGNFKSDRTHERRDERRLGVGFTGRGRGCFRGSETYGTDPANLGNLPDTGFEAALAVSSPPYASSLGDSKSGIDWGKQADRETAHSHGWDGENYGQQPGQLTALPEGDHTEACERPVCCVSSPPFCGSELSTDEQFRAKMDNPGRNWSTGAYSSQANIAQMPPGDHAEALEAEAETGRAEAVRAQACISSPPWEANPQAVDRLDGKHLDIRANPRHPGEKLYFVDYAQQTAEGSLGTITGSTFWAASREILEQVYQVLAPGAHAIWVLKMFVRSGKLVDFPGQWEALCQSVGFKTVCKHRAWLNKNAGIMQTTLDGDEVNMEKWYKSFFRTLCESKGAPRIDWELILCMVKE